MPRLHSHEPVVAAEAHSAVAGPATLSRCSILCRKVASLSHENPRTFIGCLSVYLTAQYNKAAHTLRSQKLDKAYAACLYLVATCHYAARRHQQALDVLDMEEPINKRLFEKYLMKVALKTPPMIGKCHGKISDALDNRALATYTYKDILKLHAYCFEAFDLLMSHYMLTAQEENELPESLPLSMLCTEEQELLCFLFENKFKSIIILVKDPFHANCLPVHTGTLVELNKANGLFSFSLICVQSNCTLISLQRDAIISCLVI
ncbi:hypothetical protein GH733_001418 [Mirounga leonina]|nr:hypothetical protein GH733_001418 [Mirounga leonina]